jgi:putative FmdB family regulatory protein
MPIYEYVCDSCGEVVEALQKLNDPPLTDCPTGDGGQLSKVMSAHNVGASFKSAPAPACASPGACGAPSPGACGGGGCAFN